MTEHLTRHSADHDTDHDDDFARDDVTRDDARDGAADVPDQERTDFREPGTDVDRDDDVDRGTGHDQNLSTADLASASAGPDTAGSTTETAAPAQPGGDVETPPLIDEDKVTGFRDRWQNVQTGFVDDPKQAVRQADELVAAVISALATTFAEHKGELEAQWQQGEPATEELRIALRRYRSFFDQLLPR